MTKTRPRPRQGEAEDQDQGRTRLGQDWDQTIVSPTLLTHLQYDRPWNTQTIGTSQIDLKIGSTFPIKPLTYSTNTKSRNERNLLYSALVIGYMMLTNKWDNAETTNDTRSRWSWPILKFNSLWLRQRQEPVKMWSVLWRDRDLPKAILRPRLQHKAPDPARVSATICNITSILTCNRAFIRKKISNVAWHFTGSYHVLSVLLFNLTSYKHADE